MKSIRRKEVDIKPILNAPRIIFDYKSVTGMNTEVNSIQDGISNVLNQNIKKIKKNVSKILSNVIVVGPGVVYKDFGNLLQTYLEEIFKKNVRVIVGTDPENSEYNGLLEYLSLSETYDLYNITKIELDEQQSKELEKQFAGQIKVINSFLKEMKSKKLFYPETLSRFVSEINLLTEEVDALPEGLNQIIENSMLKELQTWAKDFGNSLKSYKKNSEKSYEMALESSQGLDNLSFTIQGFNKHWLIQLFSNQIVRVKNDVNVNKVNHDSKISAKNLKIINKILSKSKEDILLLDDLSTSTGIEKKSIIKIMDKILSDPVNKKLGYLDGRLVVFSKNILLQADKFLTKLVEELSQRSQNTERTYDEIVQGVEYSNFLIRGYGYYEKRYLSQEVLHKKEILIEERINFKFDQ